MISSGVVVIITVESLVIRDCLVVSKVQDLGLGVSQIEADVGKVRRLFRFEQRIWLDTNSTSHQRRPHRHQYPIPYNKHTFVIFIPSFFDDFWLALRCIQPSKLLRPPSVFDAALLCAKP